MFAVPPTENATHMTAATGLARFAGCLAAAVAAFVAFQVAGGLFAEWAGSPIPGWWIGLNGFVFYLLLAGPCPNRGRKAGDRGIEELLAHRSRFEREWTND